MQKKSATIGAADLMAELRSNPEWVRQNEEREAKRQADEGRFATEEQPILADLLGVGLRVASVWDLVNSSASYPEALPILLNHLHRLYHPRIREGVARALAVQEAEGIAGEPVIQALRIERVPQVRWALANTLTIVADRSNAGDIKILSESPQHADIRERLLQALKNVKS